MNGTSSLGLLMPLVMLTFLVAVALGGVWLYRRVTAPPPDRHALDHTAAHPVDPALTRLARIVHAADIESEINTDPAGPGLLAIGLGGLEVEADDHRLLEKASFVYDALYAWCARQTETAS